MRYTIKYEINGVKDIRISPYVPSVNHAILWLYRQKPLILANLADLEVRPYQRGDR